jgi:hypothetical protein
MSLSRVAACACAWCAGTPSDYLVASVMCECVRTLLVTNNEASQQIFICICLCWCWVVARCIFFAEFPSLHCR